MFKFSQSSIENIQTVHPILQQLAANAIIESEYDFGVLDTGGLRTAEMQNEIYKEGYSRADGYNIKSYHQSGLAIDFVPYIDGFTWSDKKAMLSIAQTTFKVWEDMYHYNFHLHWGGFWEAKDLDDDGKLELTDKLGWDMVHFELREYPQTRGVYPIEV